MHLPHLSVVIVSVCKLALDKSASKTHVAIACSNARAWGLRGSPVACPVPLIHRKKRLERTGRTSLGPPYALHDLRLPKKLLHSYGTCNPRAFIAPNMHAFHHTNAMQSTVFICFQFLSLSFSLFRDCFRTFDAFFSSLYPVPESSLLSSFPCSSYPPITLTYLPSPVPPNSIQSSVASSSPDSLVSPCDARDVPRAP